MAGGKILRFPVGARNNIPFMLTESYIKSKGPCPCHASCAQATSLTAGGVVFTSSAPPPSLIDRSFFNKDNHNLYTDQKELLLWHCNWAHCGMDHARKILAKPHLPQDSAERGELVQQMVKTADQWASSCNPFYCNACQYA